VASYYPGSIAVRAILSYNWESSGNKRKIALAEVPILFIHVRGRKYEVGILSMTSF
jgi:hypothetical protein